MPRPQPSPRPWRARGLALALQLAVALVFVLTGGIYKAATSLQTDDTCSMSAEPQRTMLQAVATCTDFRCLREAHALPRAGALFNYPHAMIVGYPKCATTSLAAWLDQHPQAATSTPKEPEFFDSGGNCTHPGAAAPWACDPAAQRRYILDSLHRDSAVASGLDHAVFEASTGYSWGQHSTPAAIATGIRRELPWLRLVFAMREPISRAISGSVHTMEVLAQDPLPDWFVNNRSPETAAEDACLEQVLSGKNSLFACVEPNMAARKGAYADSIPDWIAAWPRDQLHIIQFENLTAPETQGAVLGDLQRFLGLDTSQAPPVLPLANSRKGQGWAMARAEYEALVRIARQQAQQVAAILERHGFYAAGDWLAAWEAAWRRNLASCDASGQCLIQLT